ncbi:unnamed protein product, partial [Meganyctiphanes norvegica]
MSLRDFTHMNLNLKVGQISQIEDLHYEKIIEAILKKPESDIYGSNSLWRLVQLGNTPETRGTAFVVYEDIFDAKNACDHLSGFNVCGRYLVVLYYQANKAFKKMDTDKKAEEINRVKTKYNINSEEAKAKI